MVRWVILSLILIGFEFLIVAWLDLCKQERLERPTMHRRSNAVSSQLEETMTRIGWWFEDRCYSLLRFVLILFPVPRK